MDPLVIVEKSLIVALLLPLTVCKSRWWSLVCCVFVFCIEMSCCEQYNQIVPYKAIVNITYKDPATGQMRSEKEESGMYGLSSRLDSEYGIVVHVRTSDNRTHGCTPPINIPKGERWIALVERGTCKFNDKIKNSAIHRNASAVVIYNNKGDGDLLHMQHDVKNVVSIFLKKVDGERIARLVDNGTKVLMHISVGTQQEEHYSNINKTSVLFVSISFIVLMIISLAWLVFYYIQRFRYAHAKERLSKRLMNAAKKAITKMPLRTVRSGDRETESDFDQCAVCIESYRASDVIRVLPCKHMFHKSCVDPWLIEQRSCPMCKMDILKAYGLQVHGSHDSVANMDLEGGSTSVGPSDVGLASHVAATSITEESPEAGVEIIHYQPPQVEYHETPATIVTECTDIETSSGEDIIAEETEPCISTEASPKVKVASAESMESVRSGESESNELQKLMPERKDGVSLQDVEST